MSDKLAEVLDVQPSNNPAPAEREIPQPETPEDLEKMGYLLKTPLYLGSTSATLDMAPILEFLSMHFGGEESNVMPILLDVSAAKQVEKLLFSKVKEMNRINEFVEMKNNPQVVTQVLAAAVKVKSLMGGKDFNIKMFVDRSKHSYTNGKELLTLMYVCGFAVRWKVKGEWYYRILSGEGQFEAFAKQRILEANQQIAELMTYIRELEALCSVHAVEEKQAAEIVKPKRGRKKKELDAATAGFAN